MCAVLKAVIVEVVGAEVIDIVGFVGVLVLGPGSREVEVSGGDGAKFLETRDVESEIPHVFATKVTALGNQIRLDDLVEVFL